MPNEPVQQPGLFAELPLIVPKRMQVGPLDYNQWVIQQEHDAVIRRLQSDVSVRQTNGLPFKSRAAAEKMQVEFELHYSHNIVAVENGFELKLLGQGQQAEKRRIAEGRESWCEAQDAVMLEMNIRQDGSGEYDATPAQWDESQRRTEARLDAQLAKLQCDRQIA